MLNKLIQQIVLVGVGLSCLPPLHGQLRFKRIDKESTDFSIIVPYMLRTESMKTVLGVAGGTNRLGQDYSNLYGAIQGSSNDSHLYLFGGNNIRLGDSQSRWFLDIMASTGRTAERKIYGGFDPTFPSLRYGSHDSARDDFFIDDTWETIADVSFKYLLPIGNLTEGPVHTYAVEGGMLQEHPSGGNPWNPLQSGRTILSFTPAYREQYINLTEDLRATARTFNFQLEVKYDNSDFYPNPMRGSRTRIQLKMDPGWLDGTDPWYSFEAQFSKYIPLPAGDQVKHQVLAFDFWTSHSPSWRNTVGPGGIPRVENAPPYFESSTLGGFWRLRGYPSNRFHDRSAIHYTMEYRVIPNWRLLDFLYRIKILDLQWIQYVVAAEAGRVAPQYDLGTLHTDMKWDLGFGIRAMFGNAVGRLEFFYSEENPLYISGMINQTF